MDNVDYTPFEEQNEENLIDETISTNNSEEVVEILPPSPDVEAMLVSNDAVCSDEQIWAMKQDAYTNCEAEIEMFKYKEHPIKLTERNQREYDRGVTFATRHQNRASEILPLPFTFTDGVYEFDTIEDILEFDWQISLHIQQCYQRRDAEIRRIEKLAQS